MVSVDKVLDIYESEGPRLWRAVAAFTRDSEIASDAVSEAFVQCIQRGAKVRSPKPWIWKAAFRIAAGEMQERSRQSPLQMEVSYEDPHFDHDILAVIAALSPQQRAAVILRYYADYDMKMIASIIGCSTATTRVHLVRARRAIGKILEAGDGSDR